MSMVHESVIMLMLYKIKCIGNISYSKAVAERGNFWKSYFLGRSWLI